VLTERGWVFSQWVVSSGSKAKLDIALSLFGSGQHCTASPEGENGGHAFRVRAR
jgi:hypothetical protein